VLLKVLKKEADEGNVIEFKEWVEKEADEGNVIEFKEWVEQSPTRFGIFQAFVFYIQNSEVNIVKT
jgi:hypothetical protein